MPKVIGEKKTRIHKEVQKQGKIDEKNALTSI